MQGNVYCCIGTFTELVTTTYINYNDDNQLWTIYASGLFW